MTGGSLNSAMEMIKVLKKSNRKILEESFNNIQITLWADEYTWIGAKLTCTAESELQEAAKFLLTGKYNIFMTCLKNWLFQCAIWIILCIMC